MRNNLIINSFLIGLLIAISVAAFTTYRLETKKRSLKEDVIELSDIKYGMFNVDAWEEQFATIITKKLEELELSGTQRDEARVKIKTFLNESIDKFEIAYKSKNEKNADFLGLSLRNIGADYFQIFGELKNQIPVITEDILDFLESEENRDGIKNYILAQINSYTEGTFQKLDYTTYNNIVSNYNAADGSECISIISDKLAQVKNQQSTSNIVIVAAFLSMLLLLLVLKETSNLRIAIYIVAAIHLLALGVFLPMIDIDARIASMELQLMGEAISFTDQVLYYKSKSIMEVSHIMLSQGKTKVMLVGILVLLFSVIFPVSKLISSIALIFKRSLQHNRFIKFMVFKSGKWSMADVMVVSIFMSYIGFTGIISGQLSQLENSIENLEILSTNKSELQNGFFFFMGFVIFSIFISQRIQKLLKTPETVEVATKVTDNSAS
ncbi:paraquat-inducible protein A [Kordia periserrulae]|uniref:Paraquat-inducible protein A n=1 Tax=Kordia periserrulae TaxID=701523 RepID=A0A2T6C5W8_9FLAO|nr:paraquat-inducible protein A [Kordia periserrulae]PTX63692.1 paraquat-inducible protein A [Kordia periserrulae]